METIKAVRRSKLKKYRPHLVKIFIVTIVLILGFFSFVAFKELKNLYQILGLFRGGRYLVLFQNNAEMRPSGGFIGSFAVVEFADYKVKKIDFNTNIYKMDNAFTAANTVAPPKPLEQIAGGKWAMRDANFAASFPESALKTEWFLKQESSETTDGTIAINASVIQNLLKITGPIELKQYNTTISADNYFTELAGKIEKEYFYNRENWHQNEPKSILKDLMPLLFEKALKSSKIALIKLLSAELAQKQILLFSHDDAIQKAILVRNWGGAVWPSKSDYLFINNANITDTTKNKNMGAKTSLKINESIDYAVKTENGKLAATLNLKRAHTGSYEWPDGVNYNWMRVLTPKGSVLRKAVLNNQDIKDGVETGEEAGKTVFGLWIETAPQTESVLQLEYVLPISAQNYHLIAQKQPGNLGDNLKVSFNGKILYNGVLKEDLKID